MYGSFWICNVYLLFYLTTEEILLLMPINISVLDSVKLELIDLCFTYAVFSSNFPQLTQFLLIFVWIHILIWIAVYESARMTVVYGPMMR